MESHEYYENVIKQLEKQLAGANSEIGVLTYTRNNIMEALAENRKAYREAFPDDIKKVKDRQTCSKERPMPKGDPGRWNHPESDYLGDEEGSLADGGSYEIYRCRVCNLKYYVQLPD